jgi:hypothetical protein
MTITALLISSCRTDLPVGDADAGLATEEPHDPCEETARIVVVPSPSGFVDPEDDCDDIGVGDGYWFAYGDQYVGHGGERCTAIGLHHPAECCHRFLRARRPTSTPTAVLTGARSHTVTPGFRVLRSSRA